MTTPERNFYRGLLQGTIATLYTVPPGKKSIVQNIDVCNQGTTNLVLYLYLVPSGASASSANVLLYNFAIPAGDSSTGNIFTWRGYEVLNDAGDTIQGYATGAVGSIHINGTEREERSDTLVM